MKRRHKQELNIFSTAAIDLFASGMGVFLILVLVIVPSFQNKPKSKNVSEKKLAKLQKDLKSLNKINSQFLTGLTQEMDTLGKTDSQIRLLASVDTTAKTQKEDLHSLAQTISKTQIVVKEIVAMMQTLSQQKQKLQDKVSVLRSQVVETQKALDQSRSPNVVVEPGKSLITAMIRWEQRKHDVDMVVRLPDGKKLSVKNGEIFSDTRSGPGGELWYLENPPNGNYKIQAFLHGKYGNEQNSAVHMTLVDKLKVITVPPKELKKEGDLVTLMSFQVENGQVISTNSAP